MTRAILLAAALSASAAAASVPYGVLLMAHGGDASWNAEIDRLRGAMDPKVPTEVALGMADVKALQAAVDRLQRRGARRISAVPLFVHSRSEVLDQTRYALGLSPRHSEVLRLAGERAARAGAAHGHPRGHGGGSAHGGHGHAFSLERVKSRVPISMSAALDDDPLVARILTERARALSREPARETIVLVAHGPVDEAALSAWEASLSRSAARVREAGGFKSCVFATLRDDAAPEVRARAVSALRAMVEAGAQDGRALVVPVLIARGGIEGKIARDLAGLDYAWDGRTLMPHEGFEAWALARAASAVAPKNP